MTLSLLWDFAQIFSWAQLSPLNKFEKMWSFGQILPLLLVAAPLIALPEFYAGSKEEQVKSKEVEETASVTELELEPMTTAASANGTRSSFKSLPLEDMTFVLDGDHRHKKHRTVPRQRQNQRDIPRQA